MAIWKAVALFSLAGCIGNAVRPAVAAGQTPVSRGCGTGKVLVGISGNQGQWMDKVRGICATVNTNGSISTTTSTTTTAGTSTGGTARTASCPAGHAVVGIIGTKDEAPFISAEVVTSIHHIECQRLDPATRRGTGSRTSVAVFPDKGDSDSHSMGPGYCIDGKVGSGIQTVSATYVHNVALSCAWAPGASTVIAAGGATSTGSTSTGSVIGSSPSAPDLIPVFNGPIFRHIAQIRKVSSEPFCHDMYAQATTAMVKTITVAPVSFGVKNAGSSDVPITSGFVVQLVFGTQTITVPVVGGLKVGETRLFTYSRTQAQTEVARMPLAPSATQQQLYNSTGGECVQTIGQDSQFNWQDPLFQVRVDATGAIASETNKTNNNKQY